MDHKSLIEKAAATQSLEKGEIAALLSCDAACAALLGRAADDARGKNVGDGVYLRGLIEFSSYCGQNCMYCGIRRDNKKAVRYRLAAREIIDLAAKAKDYGYKTVVLQSGEDGFFDTAQMCAIIKEIKKLDLAITLSIGEKTFEEYQAYKRAGADRYLLRIETTDKKLYEELDPGMSWDNRVRCLGDLKKLGYEVGSGSLAGLPGQTFESIAGDILFFKENNFDMIGIGPFIPHPETPLGSAKTSGNFETALKVMAIVRLLMPDINIPATTAMETLHPRGRLLALQNGANVVMPNVTEGDYRKFYELYPGKICTGESPAQCRYCIEAKINSIGRGVALVKGFRGDFKRGKTDGGNAESGCGF
jgi:biotin synthase